MACAGAGAPEVRVDRMVPEARATVFATEAVDFEALALVSDRVRAMSRDNVSGAAGAHELAMSLAHGAVALTRTM